MEGTSLELNLRSCKDLKAFNFFHRLSVYVVAFIFNDVGKNSNKRKHQRQQQQKTPKDKDGGGNPEWNHPMLFDLAYVLGRYCDNRNLFLKFELRCNSVVFCKRLIGEVCVPLSNLVNEFNGTIRFVSYQIRDSGGRASGVLTFSYKVTESPKNAGTVPLKVNNSSESSNRQLMEVNNSSPSKCLYPSLDDISSPLPKLSSLYPKVQYPVLHELYTKPPPPQILPIQRLALASNQGVCYNSHPAPFLQSPVPYPYPTESVGCRGYGLPAGCGDWTTWRG